MLPSFLRLFAETSASESGRIALDVCKALCRIAPVRVASMLPYGGFLGPWAPYEQLSLTPMTGSYVNIVCCDPTYWIRTAQIPMGGAMWGEDGGDDDAAKPTKEVEIATGSVELYTANVRNVLVALALPRDAWQLAAAKKYEAVVCREMHAGFWLEHITDRPVFGDLSSLLRPGHFAIQPHNFPAFRDIILGTVSP